MNLPFRRPERPASRGQAMVEFGLVLPLIALLLVMAIDFGRVFFGAVALQNAARIAADSGAMNADLWADASDAGVRDRYRQEVENDLQAINCVYASTPDPAFSDVDGDGDRYGHGDEVSVTLDCSFPLLTPLAETVLGGPVPLSADAHFPVHKTIVSSLADPRALPQCPAGEAEVPDMVGDTMQDAHALWVGAGFSSANYLPPVLPLNKSRIVLTQTTNPASAPGDCLADPGNVEVAVTHS